MHKSYAYKSLQKKIIFKIATDKSIFSPSKIYPTEGQTYISNYKVALLLTKKGKNKQGSMVVWLVSIWDDLVFG